MFKSFVFFIPLMLCQLNAGFSQIDSASLDDKIRDELIYLTIKDQTTNVYAVEYKNRLPTGRSYLSDQIRSVTITFKKGNGPNSVEQTMSESGDNLKMLLQNDALALEELNKSLLCLKEAKNSRKVWKSMQIVTIGALFTGLLIYIKSGDLTTTSTVFLISGGAAYATLGVFYFRSKIKYDKFIESINKCINIYNNNVISSHG